MSDPAASRPHDAAPPTTPVEVDGVGRLFGPVRALAGINLRVARGETCLLLGPNGSGKSTLLRILATLLRPTSGLVRYGGRTAAEAGAALRSRLAYVAHHTHLHADLTGAEALALAADLHGKGPAAAARWAERAGVTPFRDRPVRTCSRGQAQRTALACAFVADPDLVLLDEPTAGLDPAGASTLCGILADLSARGATLVVATHDADAFAALDPRTVRLDAGRLVADERPRGAR